MMPIMVTRTDFNRYMMPTYNPASFIPSKAKGSLVWDKKNKKYIDFASGIAVSSLGHCHPELNKASQLLIQEYGQTRIEDFGSE